MTRMTITGRVRTTNTASKLTKKSPYAPCSSPPRHSENGCSALVGFCSCFASSGTAAKALTHSPCSCCCRRRCCIQKTECVKNCYFLQPHRLSRDFPTVSTVRVVSPRMRQRLPTSLVQPVNLSPLILADVGAATTQLLCPVSVVYLYL